MYKQRLHVKKVFKFNQIIFIIQYRNFQYRVPSTEMSHMFSTEMSRSRDVLIPSEWSDMSFHRLLFQCTSSNKIELSVLVQNKTDLIIISLKSNLFLL